MIRSSAFKKTLSVLGLLFMFGLGYLSMSAMTSCTVDAQACFSCSLCTAPGQGVGGVTAQVSGSIIIPAIGTATALVNAYYALAATTFSGRILGKFLVVVEEFVGWFSTFWNFALRPAMQDMTDQLSTIDTDQIKSWGTFADNVEQDRTHRELYTQEADSHREVRPGENVCVAGTVTGGMGRAESFRRAYNAAAPAENLPRSAGAVGTPSEGGAGADLRARFANYVARYCSNTANRGNDGCGGAAPYADLDVDVTGQIFKKETIDLTDTTAIKPTIDDIITNITEPVIKDFVPRGALNSAPGHEAYLEGEAYKAKRQVIYDALYFVVANRAPGTKMGDFIRPIREAAGVPAAEISDNPSQYEVLHTLMRERFQSGKYAVDQIDEPENNDRELVIQQAAEVMLLNRLLDLTDKRMLIQAADMGHEIKVSKPFDTKSETVPIR